MILGRRAVFVCLETQDHFFVRRRNRTHPPTYVFPRCKLKANCISPCPNLHRCWGIENRVSGKPLALASRSFVLRVGWHAMLGRSRACRWQPAPYGTEASCRIILASRLQLEDTTVDASDFACYAMAFRIWDKDGVEGDLALRSRTKSRRLVGRARVCTTSMLGLAPWVSEAVVQWLGLQRARGYLERSLQATVCHDLKRRTQYDAPLKLATGSGWQQPEAKKGQDTPSSVRAVRLEPPPQCNMARPWAAHRHRDFIGSPQP